MSVERLELRFKDAASVQKVLHARVNLWHALPAPVFPLSPSTNDVVPVKKYVYRRFIERHSTRDISALTFPIVGCNKCRQDCKNGSYIYVLRQTHEPTRSRLSELAKVRFTPNCRQRNISIKVKVERILRYLIKWQRIRKRKRERAKAEAKGKNQFHKSISCIPRATYLSEKNAWNLETAVIKMSDFSIYRWPRELNGGRSQSRGSKVDYRVGDDA